LRKLDTTAQHIGVLHHLDGYTQEEVAERTGYSRKTVGKKLQLFETAFQALWRGAHDLRSPS
jgi:DNA-directed RNA polymerase specialized sigma24 family protein